jgi:hypothetical protein
VRGGVFGSSFIVSSEQQVILPLPERVKHLGLLVRELLQLQVRPPLI